MKKSKAELKRFVRVDSLEGKYILFPRRMDVVKIITARCILKYKGITFILECEIMTGKGKGRKITERLEEQELDYLKEDNNIFDDLSLAVLRL